MLLLIAGVVGLIFWLVAWSLGTKSIDAFGVTILIFIVAAAFKTFRDNKRARRYQEDNPGSEMSSPRSQHV